MLIAAGWPPKEVLIKSLGSPVHPCVPCGSCFLPALNQRFLNGAARLGTNDFFPVSDNSGTPCDPDSVCRPERVAQPAAHCLDGSQPWFFLPAPDLHGVDLEKFLL